MGRLGWWLALSLAACGFDSQGTGRLTDTGGSSGAGTGSSGTTAATTTITTTSSMTTTTTTSVGTGEETTGTSEEFGPWVTPIPVASLEVGQLQVDDPTLTGDQLEIFMSVIDGDEKLFTSTRATVNDPWLTPVPVVELDVDNADEGTPSVRADGLVLLFHRNTPNQSTGLDLYITTRNDRQDPWDPAVPLTDLNSASDDLAADPAWAVGRVVLCSERLSDLEDIFETSFDPGSFASATPIRVEEVSVDARDCSPRLSADGLTLWFHSDRPGADEAYDIYEAIRPSLDEPFATPVPVADVNTDSPEHDPWVSEDGLTMYFVRDVNGQRIWMTTRERL